MQKMDMMSRNTDLWLHYVLLTVTAYVNSFCAPSLIALYRLRFRCFSKQCPQLHITVIMIRFRWAPKYGHDMRKKNLFSSHTETKWRTRQFCDKRYLTGVESFGDSWISGWPQLLSLLLFTSMCRCLLSKWNWIENLSRMLGLQKASVEKPIRKMYTDNRRYVPCHCMACTCV